MRFALSLLSISFFLNACGGGPEKSPQDSERHNIGFSQRNPEDRLSTKKSPAKSVEEKDEIASTFEASKDPKARVENKIPGLVETYQGNQVTLMYPHPAHWGWIRMADADAASLYNSLAVEETQSELGMVTPSSMKVAPTVSCFREEAEEDVKYYCSIYIDYEVGSIYVEKNPSKSNSEVLEIEDNYIGENLQSYLPSRANDLHVSRLFVKGLDAAMLYQALKVKESVVGKQRGHFLAPTVKAGQDVFCLRQIFSDEPTTAYYACTIKFDHRTGERINRTLGN